LRSIAVYGASYSLPGLDFDHAIVGCQRKLVDVHVARQIIERMRQAIDCQLGHGDRQRRLGGHWQRAASNASGSATSSTSRHS
jgi:hypothetical protein